MKFAEDLPAGEIDIWQFLNEDALDVDFTLPASPASPAQVGTPMSTETEQSLALDAPDEPTGDFFADMHILPFADTSLPAYSGLPDARGTSDPTMTAFYGTSFGGFGDISTLDADAAVKLQLGNEYFDQFPQTAPAPAPVISGPDLAQLLVDQNWSLPAPPPSAPPSLISPLNPPAPLSPELSLKRKESYDSADAGPSKRPRGRPPKDRAGSSTSNASPAPKRSYTRHPKSVAALAQAAVLGTPMTRINSLDDDASEADSENARTTSAGKSSKARPKSVVPEKWLKDGSAQTILGMTADQITAFPTFAELLKKVAPALQSGAEAFGLRISENRDKAKDAAKRSREERKEKVEGLEAQVADLQGKMAGMREILAGLVARGVLTPAQVQAYL